MTQELKLTSKLKFYVYCEQCSVLKKYYLPRNSFIIFVLFIEKRLLRNSVQFSKMFAQNIQSFLFSRILSSCHYHALICQRRKTTIIGYYASSGKRCRLRLFLLLITFYCRKKSEKTWIVLLWDWNKVPRGSVCFFMYCIQTFILLSYFYKNRIYILEFYNRNK